MKKVFLVWMEIEFNAITYKKEKWYKLAKKEVTRESIECSGTHRYILAKDNQEAYSLYRRKEIYKKKDFAIETTLDLWSLLGGRLNRKDISPQLNIRSSNSKVSIKELKDALSHQDFFALCKQEMYPLEVIVK